MWRYAGPAPRAARARAAIRTRADEVLVNPRFADRYHVGVGDTFDAVILTRRLRGSSRKRATPAAPSMTSAARSTGASSAPTCGSASPASGRRPRRSCSTKASNSREILATPAFMRRYPQADAGFFGVAARLRHGAADLPAFKRAVQALPHQGAIEFQTTAGHRSEGRSRGAAAGRRAHHLRHGHRAHRAVAGRSGASPARRSSTRSTTRRSAPSASVAASSSWRRCCARCGRRDRRGRARGRHRGRRVAADAHRRRARRRARSRPVVRRTWCSARVRSPCWSRCSRSRDPPGVVVHARVHGSARPIVQSPRRRRASWGGWACRAPRLAAGTGVRMALEPGRGRTAVPVRTTIVGAALAIATVVAALTFASSLDHLVSTPRLYGWSWDARVETSGDTAEAAAALAPEGRRRHDEVEGGHGVLRLGDQPREPRRRDRHRARGRADQRGAVGPTIVDGRAPRAAGEIALGAKTLDRVGVGIGDTVQRATRRRGRAHAAAGRRSGRAPRARHLSRLRQDRARRGRAAHQGGASPARSRLRRRVRSWSRWRPGATRAELARVAGPGLIATDGPGDRACNARPTSSATSGCARRRWCSPGVLALLAIATVAHALSPRCAGAAVTSRCSRRSGSPVARCSASVAWQATTLGVARAVHRGPGRRDRRPVGVDRARRRPRHASPSRSSRCSHSCSQCRSCSSSRTSCRTCPGRIAARLRPATVLRSE